MFLASAIAVIVIVAVGFVYLAPETATRFFISRVL